MNYKAKSIKLNALVNGVRTILNLLFPLITFPYISRILSVDEIGKYNFSDSVVSYFLLIAALGINQYAVREGAKYRNDRVEFSKFSSQIYSLNIISTTISYLILLLLVFSVPKLHNYNICIFVLSAQIIFNTISVEWVYTIFEEFTYITIRSIAFKVISIVLLFVFVRQPGDYIKYSLITVFAVVGSNILNFINLKKYCDLRITFKFNWKLILKPVLLIFASNVAVLIYVNSDITMLGIFNDDYSIGIYSIAVKIYTIVKSVLTAVLTVSIPRFSMYSGTGMKKEYDILFKKVVNSIFLISIPTMTGLILLSDNAILIIAGENFLAANIPLCILCIALIFSVFNGLLSQCVLLPYNRESSFLRCTIFSAAINVVLNLILLPHYAERGAAFTTLVSEAVLCLMLYKEVKDIIGQTVKNKQIINNLFTVVISSIVMACCCYFLLNCLDGFVVSFIFSIFISAVVYGLMLLLLKNELIHSVICGLRKK